MNKITYFEFRVGNRVITSGCMRPEARHELAYSALQPYFASETHLWTPSGDGFHESRINLP